MKKILAPNWKWFVVIALVSALLWNGVFSLVCAPKRHQILQIYITAKDCKSNSLKNDLATKLENVQKIKVFAYNSTAKNYDDSFLTLAITDCDLIIFEKQYFHLEPEVTGEQFAPFEEFAPLDESTLQKYGINATNYTFLQYNGQNYGIVVYDKELGINLLGNYFAPCDDTKQYCVVVNPFAPNAGEFSTTKNTSDNAFWALSALLSLQK